MIVRKIIMATLQCNYYIINRAPLSFSLFPETSGGSIFYLFLYLLTLPIPYTRPPISRLKRGKNFRAISKAGLGHLIFIKVNLVKTSMKRAKQSCPFNSMIFEHRPKMIEKLLLFG